MDMFRLVQSFWNLYVNHGKIISNFMCAKLSDITQSANQGAQP